MDSLKDKISKFFFKASKLLANFYFFSKKSIFKIFKIKKGISLNTSQDNLDKKLIFSLSKSKFPSIKQLKYINKFLGRKEILVIKSCFLIIAINLAFLGLHYYKTHTQIVPIIGGEYTEGLVGVPKNINPLYSSASDVDNDISSLIFSSLFKHNKNGELIGDLVNECSVNEDNKIYTCLIKTEAKWHHEKKVTVEDIIFTFNAIKNNEYKSPLRSSLTGVNIEKIDEQTIKFILAEPYAAFFEILTFGILPQDLWLQITPEAANLAELNLKPIGSGPYKFKSLTKDKAGNIKGYNLVINEEYYGDKSSIEFLSFKFFANFEEAVSALNENIIEGISYLPLHSKDKLVAKDSLSMHKLNLPQVAAVFFNSKKEPESSGLDQQKVRQALALAIDKNRIKSSCFGGEARLIDSPILPDSFAYNNEANKYKYNIEEADKLLNEAGWKIIKISDEDIIKATEDAQSEDEKMKEAALNKLALDTGEWRIKDNKYLTITLTTVETDDNIKVVEIIKEFWEKIGVKVFLNIIPTSQIQSEIIKPRNFQALLYGQIVGNDPDSYAFWHSSQVSEAGLNIANYINKEVDKLLEDARLTSNIEERIEKYKKFQEILAQDVPAIFIYTPIYTYVQSRKVKGFEIKNILLPRDRFSNINEWYIKTGKKFNW